MSRDLVFLADIREAIRRILRYTEKGKGLFLSDTLVQDGVLRNYQVLGEAARRVSEEFKNTHADIPWSDMIAMRNVVIHDYAELDLETLWETTVRDLPSALEKLEPLFPPEEPKSTL